MPFIFYQYINEHKPMMNRPAREISALLRNKLVKGLSADNDIMKIKFFDQTELHIQTIRIPTEVALMDKDMANRPSHRR